VRSAMVKARTSSSVPLEDTGEEVLRSEFCFELEFECDDGWVW
jgi:hypothetical protein